MTRCKRCESEEVKVEKYNDDEGFERERTTCEVCGYEEEE